jgi:hypothetical protein
MRESPADAWTSFQKLHAEYQKYAAKGALTDPTPRLRIELVDKIIAASKDFRADHPLSRILAEFKKDLILLTPEQFAKKLGTLVNAEVARAGTGGPGSWSQPLRPPSDNRHQSLTSFTSSASSTAISAAASTGTSTTPARRSRPLQVNGVSTAKRLKTDTDAAHDGGVSVAPTTVATPAEYPAMTSRLPSPGRLERIPQKTDPAVPQTATQLAKHFVYGSRNLVEGENLLTVQGFAQPIVFMAPPPPVLLPRNPQEVNAFRDEYTRAVIRANPTIIYTTLSAIIKQFYWDYGPFCGHAKFTEMKKALSEKPGKPPAVP